MKRAYSYIRYSDKRQEKGDSIRRQTKMTEDYCQRKNLFLDDSVSMEDSGKSAFHGVNSDTGALSAFLEDVKVGRIAKKSVLIVENLDRLDRRQTLKAFNLFSGILESGITIVTLSPEREYTEEAVNENVGMIMEAVLSLFLGHEESRKKSGRVLAEWRGRFAKIGTQKMTARCPSWLTLRSDRKAFDPKPDAVKIVKKIFRWATEGLGIISIVRRLNEAGIPSIGGRGNGWETSFVRSILRGRAVLGEYQSMTGKGKDMKPFGPVVIGYYPAVISEVDYYNAQSAIESRKTQCGPRGHHVANLFTGLMHDARDHGSLHLARKANNEISIVPGRAKKGYSGSIYLSFPYQLIEDSILSFLEEVKPSDILLESVNETDMVAELSGKISTLDHNIAVMKEKMRQYPEMEEPWTILAGYEKDKKSTLILLERAKEAKSVSSAETIGEVQSMVKFLRSVPIDERDVLRSRLKGKIRLLISEIWSYFTTAPIPGSRGRVCQGRVACIQIFFKSGGSRMIFISSLLRAKSQKRAARIEDVSPDQDLRHNFAWVDEMIAKIGKSERTYFGTPPANQGIAL